MVQEKRTQEDIVYVCEECGFRYAKKEIAEQCQAWCKGHKSCNIEITSHGTPPEA